jgi:sugar lactone lactonase YvrE
VNTFASTPATDRMSTLGEGPVWDAERGRVLCVDVTAGEVLAGPLSGDRVELEVLVALPHTVGAVVPAADGGLLVAGESGLLTLTSDGDVVHGPRLVAPGVDSRLNDGGCDPSGRFLVGSMARDGRIGEEVLHRLEDDGSVGPVLGGLTLSNGLAWSPDGTTLYHADTVPGRVRAYPYDDTGELGTPRTLLDDPDRDPDGLCVDAAGRLWIAFWGEGAVRCLTPEGRHVASVEVAAPNTTSVAFVGPGLGRLLISTASEGLSSEQVEAYPDSGRLFVADVDISGAPVAAWSGSSRVPPWS